MRISPKAVVDSRASIDSSSHIGPFVIIEDDVTIGPNCRIMAHAVVKSGTTIGSNCNIHEGAVVGGDPQDLKYEGESTKLRIEDNVTIREFCTVNRGTKAKGTTIIKSGVLIMAYSHVAHDCTIGENSVLSNCAQIAGHVEIDEYAILGGMTAVQQFVKIGRHAYIGGGTLVRKDVPPYIKAAREPLMFMGVNSIGLNRRGYSAEQIQDLENLYKTLFIKHQNLGLAIEALQQEDRHSDYRQEILSFVENSRNGIIKGYK